MKRVVRNNNTLEENPVILVWLAVLSFFIGFAFGKVTSPQPTQPYQRIVYVTPAPAKFSAKISRMYESPRVGSLAYHLIPPENWQVRPLIAGESGQDILNQYFYDPANPAVNVTLEYHASAKPEQELVAEEARLTKAGYVHSVYTNKKGIPVRLNRKDEKTKSSFISYVLTRGGYYEFSNTDSSAEDRMMVISLFTANFEYSE